MADSDKIVLTAEEAESLFPEGEYVHNFANPGGMLVGCDYDRADAVKALAQAKMIELAGDTAKSLKHPIAVWDAHERLTFFAADMDKVAALEAARVSA